MSKRATSLQPLFLGQRSPGVYRYASRAKAQSILHTVAYHGWRGFAVDGNRVVNKQTFLEQSAKSMNFPSYFGRNWDAFWDSIRDLSWCKASGYVLLYDHVRHFATMQPHEWQTALELLSEAAADWNSHAVEFYVLLRGAGRTAPEVPWL
jgi:RNAse (barnase) inhibitor barstar